MARLIALYKTPAEPAAFAVCYPSTHLPLARTIPGLTGDDMSLGPVAGLGGLPGGIWWPRCTSP